MLKRIQSMIKRTRRHEAVFETFSQKHKNGEKIPQEDFNKLVKRIDKCVAISRKLDAKIEEILHKRKLLEKELQELKTGEFWPSALIERMGNFCKTSYAEYPIVSKKCEKFLKEFAVYQALYEAYKKIEDNKEPLTMKQLTEFERQLEDFASNVSKDKSYNFAVLRIREGLQKQKFTLIDRAFSNGASTENQITVEEIQKLIQQLSAVGNAEEETTSINLKSLSDLTEKINAAISEINKAVSIDELETVYQKALEQFKQLKGSLDFSSAYNLKKDELIQKDTAAESSLLKPIPLSMSFQSSPEKNNNSAPPVESSQTNLMDGMDIEPHNTQNGEEASTFLKPIRIEEQKSESLPAGFLSQSLLSTSLLSEGLLPESLLPETKPVIENTSVIPATNNLNEENSKPKSPVPIMSNNVLVLFEVESQKRTPPSTKEKKPEEQPAEHFEPPLVKKVKDNEGNQIVTEQAEPQKEDKVGQLRDKLSKLTVREGIYRSPRKDIGRHIDEIARVIHEDIEEDNSGREEQVWLDLFSQVAAEADSLRSVWKLLDEEFDSSFFRKMFYMTTEQRKDIDKKAYEEIEKNRMQNSSAKQIISRLMQPIKFARKSLFEP